MSKLDTDLKNLKKLLEERAKKFTKIKEKNDTKILMDFWKKEYGQNPLDIVVDFIKEKGLKLYGGKALHEHLKKFKRGFYASHEFPDYDVFSPNAWQHAKELANRLHDAGFDYVEAKGSILNDEVHQTYKVGVSLVYVLDLTQLGCVRDKLISGKCDGCGIDREGKCIDTFNYVPANNLLDYKPHKRKETVERKTYDYTTDKGLYPNSLFVCSPDYLKISMNRELSEPLSQPDRLPKVGTRNHLFNHFFKHDASICDPEAYKVSVDKKWKKVLDTIGKWVNKNKLIHFGATSYNFFVKGLKTPHYGAINVADYEVYSPLSEEHANKLLELLEKKYPNYKFKLNRKEQYWKEVDYLSIEILVSDNDKDYNLLIELVDHDKCMPYVQYKGVRYASIDRMKYHFMRASVMRPLVEQGDLNIKNYECMITTLLEIQKKLKTKSKSKYRNIISKCSGDEVSKIVQNLKIKSIQKKLQLQKTKYILDSPKKGYISKITPMPSGELKLPYYPELQKLKKYYTQKRVLTRKGKYKTKLVRARPNRNLA